MTLLACAVVLCGSVLTGWVLWLRHLRWSEERKAPAKETADALKSLGDRLSRLELAKGLGR